MLLLVTDEVSAPKGIGNSPRCIITMDTTGLSDLSEWYDFWEHAVAINAMCYKFRKNGRASGLSKLTKYHRGSEAPLC